MTGSAGESRVAGTDSGVFVSVFTIPQVFLWIHSVIHVGLCTEIFFCYAQAKVLKYWKDSLTAAVSLLWSFYFSPFILSKSKSGQQEGEGTTINQRILFQCSSSNSLTSKKKGRLTLGFKHVVLCSFQQQRAAFHRADSGTSSWTSPAHFPGRHNLKFYYELQCGIKGCHQKETKWVINARKFISTDAVAHSAAVIIPIRYISWTSLHSAAPICDHFTGNN